MAIAQAQSELKTNVAIRELMEVGAHFGHPKAKWNPKMKKYIHTSRNGVYIINLQKTVGYFRDALEAARSIAASGQKVLFVGTKRQAKESIKEEALRVGQPYVNERWIGGCLTNFHTLKRSVSLMKQLRKMEDEKNYGLRKKKEILLLRKKLEKLELYYDGIKDMTELPGALFVIDPHREYIAINEAITLGIPVIATLDTNCDPDKVDYKIPGNDDSMRAIRLYSSKVADAIEEGSQQRQSNIERMTAEAPAAAPKNKKEEVPVAETTPEIREVSLADEAKDEKSNEEKSAMPVIESVSVKEGDKE